MTRQTDIQPNGDDWGNLAEKQSWFRYYGHTHRLSVILKNIASTLSIDVQTKPVSLFATQEVRIHGGGGSLAVNQN